MSDDVWNPVEPGDAAAELARLRHAAPADTILRKLLTNSALLPDGATMMVSAACVALDAGELAYLRSLSESETPVAALSEEPTQP